MSGNHRLQRRHFLRLSGMGIAGTAFAVGAPSTVLAEIEGAREKTTTRLERPAKIVFLVSDGMSQGVPGLAELFSRQVRGRPTYFAEMLRRQSVAHGLFETHSLNSFVTDSAAASSAWGSGSRVRNGALNTLPNGTALKPIFAVAHEQGWGTGVVTTATVTHATPAGFTVAHPDRGGEDTIAVKYLNAADIVMGGGISQFRATERGDKRDLEGEFSAAGYSVVDHRDTMLGLGDSEKKILGVFSNGALPYTLEQINNPELVNRVPTLAEMTEKAIATLERHHGNGWILQVEGARVDHAAHTNDAAGIIWDQLAFDDAVGVALEFTARHPETLVLVTSDHGNANPGLSAYGGSTNEMFERIALAKGTTHDLRAAMRGHEGNAADLHEIVRDMLGLDLKKEHAEAVVRMLAGDFSMVAHDQLRNFNGAFNSLLSNYNGIGWVSTQHTEDYTLIAAAGPMQERFGALLKNTDAFAIMAEAMGSDFSNPFMTPEQARKLASAPAASRLQNDGFVHA